MLTADELRGFPDYLWETTRIPMRVYDGRGALVAESSGFFPFGEPWYQEVLEEAESSGEGLWVRYSLPAPVTDATVVVRFGEDGLSRAVIGPLLVSTIRRYRHSHEVTALRANGVDAQWEEVERRMAWFDEHALRLIGLVCKLVAGRDFTPREARRVSHQDRYDGNDVSAQRAEYGRRDYEGAGRGYRDGKKFYECIRRGDNYTARIIGNRLMSIPVPRITDSWLLDDQYRIVSVITLMTEEVLRAGVKPEKAYALRQVYTAEVARCTSTAMLNDSFGRAIIDYCQATERARRGEYPGWVLECRDYVESHLHQPFALKDVAREVLLNPQYLSTTYKRLTGESLSAFIRRRKVEEAQFMLTYEPKASVSQIAATLCFSSPSHFASAFKAVAGETPSQYRKRTRRS